MFGIKHTSKVIKLSNFLIFISIIILAFVFWPITKEEALYEIRKNISIDDLIDNEQLDVSNKDFSIIIPKIYAAAPIIANVNPFDKKIFSSALKDGVAHASGTSFPGRPGNVYLFAHSTDAFYNIGRYNAVFYLIGKLQKGDLIKLFFQNREYDYIVFEKAVVAADDIFYLQRKTDEKLLTLQTCYPPGTTLKRLVVIAKLEN